MQKKFHNKKTLLLNKNINNNKVSDIYHYNINSVILEYNTILCCEYYICFRNRLDIIFLVNYANNDRYILLLSNNNYYHIPKYHILLKCEIIDIINYLQGHINFKLLFDNCKYKYFVYIINPIINPASNFKNIYVIINRKYIDGDKYEYEYLFSDSKYNTECVTKIAYINSLLKDYLMREVV